MKKSTTIRIFSILLVMLITLSCSTITNLINQVDDTDSTERTGIGNSSQEDDREKPSTQNEEEKPPRQEGKKPPADSENAPPRPQQEDNEDIESPFPLPPDAESVQDLAGTINFQTGMSIDETVSFYRDVFDNQGLTERKLLTVIEDTTFSIVFDGAPNGQAIVVQGVDFGETTNVNLRYEDT